MSISKLTKEHIAQAIMDWMNEDTGELLTKYDPTPELLHILTKNIDSELK